MHLLIRAVRAVIFFTKLAYRACFASGVELAKPESFEKCKLKHFTNFHSGELFYFFITINNKIVITIFFYIMYFLFNFDYWRDIFILG